MSEGNGSAHFLIDNNTGLTIAIQSFLLGPVLIISECSKLCPSTHTCALVLLNLLLELSLNERVVCHGGEKWWS